MVLTHQHSQIDRSSLTRHSKPTSSRKLEMQYLGLSSVQTTMSVSVYARSKHAAASSAALYLLSWHHSALNTAQARNASCLTLGRYMLMQTPKASGAGQLTCWRSSSPAQSDDGSVASGQSAPQSCPYYEQELERLRAWHPRQSRFGQEQRRKSSNGGAPAPPHSFHHRDCLSSSAEH
jgi:hypothetical protein